MSERVLGKIKAIDECLRRVGQTGATRKEIAECLGLKVTPYLKGMIQELLNRGFARAEWETEAYPPRWRYFWQEGN